MKSNGLIFRIGYFIGGLGLILTLCSAQIQPQRERAGRKWHIGEVLPDSIINPVLHMVNQEEDAEILLLVFTREDHRYSDRFVNQLNEFIPEGIRQQMPVVEILAPLPGTVLDTTRSHPWPWIDDTLHGLYAQFGVRVFPTLFILSPKGEILNYMPGFTPTLKSHLTKALNPYFPDDIPLPSTVSYDRSAKRKVRKEDLARKLVDKKHYQIALNQLLAIDTLSVSGQVLLAMTYLHLEDWTKADSMFRLLPDQRPYSGYRNFGLGLLSYYQGHPEQALAYLSAIKTIPEMYRVHFWKGEVLTVLGQPDRACDEYRKSAVQSAKKIHSTFLP